MSEPPNISIGRREATKFKLEPTVKTVAQKIFKEFSCFFRRRSDYGRHDAQHNDARSK